MDIKNQLARKVMDFKAIKLQPNDPFTWASGWKSPIYTDNRKTLSFTTLFANLIGFLPMQLGVQEGGFVLSIAALGLSAALGIFVSIICRVREIIWIIVGILLMKIK